MKRSSMMLAVLLCSSAAFELPDKGVLFFETFDGKAEPVGWTVTSMPNYTGEWKVRTPPRPHTDTFERMLYMKSPKAYHAISTVLEKPVSIPRRHPFILQFEMRATKNITCSGAYIKLFTDKNFNPQTLSNETNQLLMFGPDICKGNNRIAFYFRHLNKNTGNSVEKRLINTPQAINDQLNHLYTLILRQNGTLTIMIDNEPAYTTDFVSSFDPPVIPSKEIEDPLAQKPSDWDDREFIQDPSEPVPVLDSRKMIPDPALIEPPEGWLLDEEMFVQAEEKPPEWDESLLGPFEAPIVRNPKCRVGCGKYYPPLIKNPNYEGDYRPKMVKNPNYQGQWKRPMVPNPEYFEDRIPHKRFPDITAVGFELWSVDAEIGFNNILLSNNEMEVRRWNNENFVVRRWEQRKALNPRTAPTPNVKVVKGWTPVSVLGIAIWQIMDSWKDLYAVSQSATLALTGSVILIPLLLMCFCCRYQDQIEEEEEINEEEDK